MTLALILIAAIITISAIAYAATTPDSTTDAHSSETSTDNYPAYVAGAF